MNRGILGAALFAALGAAPADARLQISIGANGATFTCFDGQLGCDQSGGANNLLLVNTSVGGAFVEIALTQSTFGAPDSLQLSTSSIVNESGASITIKLIASDTNFVPPVAAIHESASLTFNDAVGSTASTLQFWADPANVQGANPANTPGVLLDTVTGVPVTNPDSFSGTHTTAFAALAPFSMTEGASLNLVSGGSITGFNQSMTSAGIIPEPSTWVMIGLGFGILGWIGWRRNSRIPLTP
jgi:hypothetical protein